MFILFYYAVTYIVAEEKYSQKNIEVCKLNHGKTIFFFSFSASFLKLGTYIYKHIK